MLGNERNTDTGRYSGRNSLLRFRANLPGRAYGLRGDVEMPRHAVRYKRESCRRGQVFRPGLLIEN